MRKIKKAAALLAAVLTVLSSVFISADGAGIAYGAAQVSVSCLNIRSSPDTLGRVTGRVCENSMLIILEKTTDKWYHVNFNGVDGYVAGVYLRGLSAESALVTVGTVTDDDVRMRYEPNTDCDTYGYYDRGTRVLILGICNGWYKIKYDGHTGYMRSDYITVADEYVPSETPVEKVSPVIPDPPSGNEGTELGRRIAEYCSQFIGCNYVYGGSSPLTGFDCSGLMYYVYAQFGYSIARGAESQYYQNGTEVALSDLQPGDLIFFANPDYGEGITHVGMYVGDNCFVHASDYDVGVIKSEINAYRISTFFGAKRIISE